MRVPLLYRAYVGLGILLVPFIARSAIAKLRAADVPALRAHECVGVASVTRPHGRLIWFHVGSEDQSLSVLALITRMGTMLPDAHFLITSGTSESATRIAQRMPPHSQHQFAPLDAAGPLKRFLKHWRPDAAIFVESTLWPQMLRRTRTAGASMALVNPRMSAKSLRYWRKQPKLAAYVLDAFDLILMPNDAMANAMVKIHAPAPRVARGQNLKSFAAPLPTDEDLIFEARAALGQRPVWVAASTHSGEEQTLLAAHQKLLTSHPELLLILAPENPQRSAEVIQHIAYAGLEYTRRSRGDMPANAVLLADTLGELGSWFALSDIVFLGGSLLPVGGYNPAEAAQSGATVLSGNHIFNFAETFSAMEAAGAARLISGSDDLAAKIDMLLRNTASREKAVKAAHSFATQETDKLDIIASRLINALSLK